MLSKGKLRKVSVLKRNLDSQGMQAFKEKQNAEEREKNRRKSEMKRNPKKKQVKVKMKRNKEEGPK